MICELDPIVLVDDLPEHGLRAGDLGTVVHVYPGGKGLEVEFVALNGETLAVVSLLPTQVRSVASREIAHARAVG